MFTDLFYALLTLVGTVCTGVFLFVMLILFGLFFAVWVVLGTIFGIINVFIWLFSGVNSDEANYLSLYRLFSGCTNLK